MLRYVDTSALVRCYFPDEPDHEELRALLLEAVEPVVTSELTRLEVASAVHAAHRAGRLRDPAELLDVVDTDCGEDGPIALLRLQPEVVFGLAADLVAKHPLRSLDALHLAVARSTAAELAAGEPVVLVTRDHRQAAAAAALGMPVE
ncbi:type II toxin-antitoxin system VapC family toxin [Pseudonocardia adelaidensis]|uniref:Ribonuclease VapC n=1 Tax=Pseudonocardia adelaidensis TaxID=648754 RepID=A0ABP9NHI7_9PSEU